MSPRIPVLCLAAVLLTPFLCYAQSPNPERLFEIGMNALTGIGDSYNEQTALENIRRSADVGYAPAQVMLGYFYETGRLVTREPGQAADWYKKASKQGDPIGSWLLGRLYYTGTGVPHDLNLAAAALQKAASQDDPFGEYLLGMVLLERPNYPQAASWFRKAALQGLPQAQLQLGLLLQDGKGMNVDKTQAYQWLLMSYEAGNQAAASPLRQLEGELSSSQIDQAKDQVRELQQTSNRVVVARGCTGWPGEFDAVPAPPPPDIQTYCR
jgi:tetratricopeptide (TPR) repeat protein